MNPFKYGSIVLGKDFCGRKDLLKQIAAHMEASQNIVIVGERRIGKSSLVYEAVRKLRGTTYFIHGSSWDQIRGCFVQEDTEGNCHSGEKSELDG